MTSFPAFEVSRERGLRRRYLGLLRVCQAFNWWTLHGDSADIGAVYFDIKGIIMHTVAINKQIHRIMLILSFRENEAGFVID